MIIAGLGLTTLCVGGTAYLMNAIFNKRGSMTSQVRLPQPVVGPQEGAPGLCVGVVAARLVACRFLSSWLSGLLLRLVAAWD